MNITFDTDNFKQVEDVKALLKMLEDQRQPAEESASADKINRLSAVEDIPIDELELTVRALNVLNSSGIRNVGDLVALGIDGARKLRGVGRVSILEIDSTLESLGVEWK